MKLIVKKFNNLIQKTIFKVQNKTNNNFNISSFNKHLITLIALLFIYLFYLLTPLLYDKTWLQANIESKLLKEFKISISTSADISYRILPSPHFLIKDSKILVKGEKNNKSLAEVKDLKIFISQKNLFNKKKMNLSKILIKNANFSLTTKDIKLLSEFKDQNFSNKKIKINDSTLFFKDNLGDIITIIKIYETVLFFDDKKLLNFVNLKGEAFNVPLNFNFQNRNDPGRYEKINFNSKLLKLDILNESNITKNKLINGVNVISFLNSKLNTKYKVKEKLIIFQSDNSRLNNLQIDYKGELSINPFDLDLNIYLDNYRISRLFNINSILNEFIKSGLLFNDNISVNISTTISSDKKNEIFQNAKINFHIINGKIDFNKTRFVNNGIGSLQLNNSNLFLKNDRLIFNSEILIDIKNSELLFSFFNTNKKYRKDIKTILINLEYDFLNNQIKFNNLKVDNVDVNTQLSTIIDDINGNDLNNFIKSRRLINELFKAYAG